MYKDDALAKTMDREVDDFGGFKESGNQKDDLEDKMDSKALSENMNTETDELDELVIEEVVLPQQVDAEFDDFGDFNESANEDDGLEDKIGSEVNLQESVNKEEDVSQQENSEVDDFGDFNESANEDDGLEDKIGSEVSFHGSFIEEVVLPQQVDAQFDDFGNFNESANEDDGLEDKTGSEVNLQESVNKEEDVPHQENSEVDDFGDFNESANEDDGLEDKIGSEVSFHESVIEEVVLPQHVDAEFDDFGNFNESSNEDDGLEDKIGSEVNLPESMNKEEDVSEDAELDDFGDFNDSISNQVLMDSAEGGDDFGDFEAFAPEEGEEESFGNFAEFGSSPNPTTEFVPLSGEGFAASASSILNAMQFAETLPPDTTSPHISVFFLGSQNTDPLFGPSKCHDCGALIRCVSTRCLLCGTFVPTALMTQPKLQDCVASIIGLESRCVKSNSLAEELRLSKELRPGLLLGKELPSHFVSKIEPTPRQHSEFSSSAMASRVMSHSLGTLSYDSSCESSAGKVSASEQVGAIDVSPSEYVGGVNITAPTENVSTSDDFDDLFGHIGAATPSNVSSTNNFGSAIGFGNFLVGTGTMTPLTANDGSEEKSPPEADFDFGEFTMTECATGARPRSDSQNNFKDNNDAGYVDDEEAIEFGEAAEDSITESLNDIHVNEKESLGNGDFESLDIAIPAVMNPAVISSNEFEAFETAGSIAMSPTVSEIIQTKGSISHETYDDLEKRPHSEFHLSRVAMSSDNIDEKLVEALWKETCLETNFDSSSEFPSFSFMRAKVSEWFIIINSH